MNFNTSANPDYSFDPMNGVFFEPVFLGGLFDHQAPELQSMDYDSITAVENVAQSAINLLSAPYVGEENPTAEPLNPTSQEAPQRAITMAQLATQILKSRDVEKAPLTREEIDDEIEKMIQLRIPYHQIDRELKLKPGTARTRYRYCLSRRNPDLVVNPIRKRRKQEVQATTPIRPKGHRFTDEEDKLIADSIGEQKLSYEQIAQLLNRINNPTVESEMMTATKVRSRWCDYASHKYPHVKYDRKINGHMWMALPE